MKSAIVTMAIALPLLCLLLAALPRLDAAVCVPRAARNVGVEPTYEAINAYITRSVTPGMTLDKALAVLGRIGPVVVSFTSPSPLEDMIMRDQAYIDMCAVPFNDIRLFITYRSDTLRITGISIDGS